MSNDTETIKVKTFTRHKLNILTEQSVSLLEFYRIPQNTTCLPLYNNFTAHAYATEKRGATVAALNFSMEMTKTNIILQDTEITLDKM